MKLFDDFNWYLDDRFTTGQLSLILVAGYDLEAYIDRLDGVPGQAWMQQHTHGTRIHRGGLFTRVAAKINKLPTSLVLPYRDIWLAENFERFNLPKRHVLHELGHVVENRLSKSFLLPPTIVGGGAADRLTQFLGGKAAGLRFMNGTSGIPARFHWRGAGSYGNHSTADYFAEALSWLPYDLTALPDPHVADWFLREVFSR